MFRRPVKSWAYLAILCIVGGTKMTPSKKDWDNVAEEFYDNIETAMFSKATIDKDTTMLIWLSKTKMKHRGYVEKTETDLTVNPFLELMKAATSDDKPQK